MRQSAADVTLPPCCHTYIRAKDRSGHMKKIHEAFKLVDMNSYIKNSLELDLAELAKMKPIHSGYENLDKITSIYPGLYVIGAVSSLGKTTFMHQMADQIADEGKNVLYISLEQTKQELATKSLSRLMANINVNEALTAIQIRNNIHNDCLDLAKEMYSNKPAKVTVAYGERNATMRNIENVINKYMLENNCTPVVIIDYLQTLEPGDDKRMTMKEQVDDDLRGLKLLQMKNNMVIMVISSFNRQNYLEVVDFTSFKESGGIEYTADVVWGLQLSVVHEDTFEKSSKISKKRELFAKAKASSPREIELVCLKNRFGISNYVCKFDYFAEYDYFVPVE